MDSSKIFSIHGKGLKLDTQADIEPYLAELRAMDDVEEVHFGGNTLGVEACQALAEVLKTKKSLKVADFADIFTGRLITEIPTALAAICDALIDHTSLVEIDLSDNAFGGRSSEPMVPFLSRNRSFQILKLNNNGLGPSGGTIVANALLESAKASKAEGKRSNLHTVICGRTRLEDSVYVWAEAFALHGTLVKVSMPNDGIKMEPMIALVEGLSQCPALEYLDLRDNNFLNKENKGIERYAGTRALAHSLASWPALRYLDISDCLLDPKGAVLLALALEDASNTKLEALKLEYDELDHRAINILARAISRHMPSLTALHLNGNVADPDDECIGNIREALASHGNEDALDELEDMEDPTEEEEEEEAEEEEEEEAIEDETGKEKEPAVSGNVAEEKDAEDDDTTQLVPMLAAVSISKSIAETTPSSAPPATSVDVDMDAVDTQTRPETTTSVPSSAPEANDVPEPEPIVSLPSVSSTTAPATQTLALPITAPTESIAEQRVPIPTVTLTPPLESTADPVVEPNGALAETIAGPAAVAEPSPSSSEVKEKPAIKKRRSILASAGDKLSSLFGKMNIAK